MKKHSVTKARMSSVRIIQTSFRGVSLLRQHSSLKCRNVELRSTLPGSSVLLLRSYAKKGKKHTSRVDVKHSADAEILDLDEVRQKMESVLDHLKAEYVKYLQVRTSPGAFDHVMVKTSDGRIPLNQLGQINVKSAQKFTINMSDSPQAVNEAVKAIRDSGMNLNPQADGTVIQIPIPKVTKEHRENLSKTAKVMCDKAKVNIRNVRSKVMNDIKKHKDSASKDVIRQLEKQVQQLTDDYNEHAEQSLSAKNKELLLGK